MLLSQLERYNPLKYLSFPLEAKYNQLDLCWSITTPVKYKSYDDFDIIVSLNAYETKEKAYEAIKTLDFMPTQEFLIYVENYYESRVEILNELGVEFNPSTKKYYVVTLKIADERRKDNSIIKEPHFRVSAEEYVTLTEATEVVQGRKAYTELRPNALWGKIEGTVISNIKVLKSNAGYYIGRLKYDLKPNREVIVEPYDIISSEYFKLRDEAMIALFTRQYTYKLNP